MQNAEILATLTKIVAERFGLETDSFTEETRLGDVGLDSMHVVDIMLDIEDELGFKITDLALPPNPSLGDICAEISRNSSRS